MIIKNSYVVTVDSKFSTFVDGGIAVDQGRIVAVSTSQEIDGAYSAGRIIDAKGLVAMPGLVNAHTHAAMVFLRGLADDLPLKEWLENHIWPAEAKFVSPAFIEAATRLALYEMVRSGTTLFCDMYFLPEHSIEAISKFRLKAMLGVPLLDFPTPVSKSPKEGFDRTRKLIELLKGDDKIEVAISPHSLYTCSEGVLREAAELAKEYDKPIQIHLSEEKWESEKIFAEKNMSPVSYLNSLGVLGKKTIAAHVNWLFDGDIEILKETGVGIAHNPQSNMKLATGICPVPDLINAKIKIGLGTDGAASNNDLDVFGEMETAARLHKISRNDPTAVSAKEALYMATLGGAEVLSLADKLGSLEAGKRADIILVDTDKPHMQPIYDIHSQLVYSAKGSDVKTVMVDGEIVYEDYQLLVDDHEEVLSQAKSFAKMIRQPAS
ncbi:MAG: amidohydrolase [Actinomycetota bacterium]|nr:amidohydrolase [Actinomycetota bacterium]